MSGWRELSNAPAPGTRLCLIDEVPDGEGREVTFGEGPDTFRVLLLRRGKQMFAYHNCCPHFSLPLNYEPQVFHVYDREYLMCAHHTALFRIEDGHCFDGPCTGARLTAITVRNVGGTIVIA